MDVRRRSFIVASPSKAADANELAGRSSDFAGTGASPSSRRFPSRAGLSALTAFVPAYRCGAVPEFHRVPFSGPYSRTTGCVFSVSQALKRTQLVNPVTEVPESSRNFAVQPHGSRTLSELRKRTHFVLYFQKLRGFAETKPFCVSDVKELLASRHKAKRPMRHAAVGRVSSL